MLQIAGVILNLALDISLAKGWADKIPNGLVIVLYILSILPFAYWVITHEKTLRQREWLKDRFRNYTLSSVAVIIVLGFVVVSTVVVVAPRLWRLLTPAIPVSKAQPSKEQQRQSLNEQSDTSSKTTQIESPKAAAELIPTTPKKKHKQSASSPKVSAKPPEQPGVSTVGDNSPAVGSISQGAGSALSINQQGGITAGTINVGAEPCRWKSLTDHDYIAIASKVASIPAKLYVAIPPSNDDAARFAGYTVSSLSHYGHWNTDDFEQANSSMWVNHPGITIIVRDAKALNDPNSPAVRLKGAIESLKLTVHTYEVKSLSAEDDLGLWVGACE